MAKKKKKVEKIYVATGNIKIGNDLVKAWDTLTKEQVEILKKTPFTSYKEL